MWLSLNKNWNTLIKSSKILYHGDIDDVSVSTVVMESLERGFGLTLWNALRRKLLSSPQDAAITSFKNPRCVTRNFLLNLALRKTYSISS